MMPSLSNFDGEIMITKQNALADAASRANRIPWPPILDLTVALSAYLLERLAPLPTLDLGGPITLLGWVAAVAGVALGASGVLAFRRGATTVNPAGAATTLVTGGVYAYTRNPMYLGTLIMFAGLAFALHSLWLLVILPALFAGLQQLAISGEERHLAARFGADWLAYASRVRRWI
jgi:protein-S-isoprenylcysteine O-methyltransferase Ste14